MAYQNIVQELYDARSKSDLERMMTFLHPDGVFHIVGSEHLSPLTQRLEGAHLVRPVAGQLLSDWDMSRVENIDVHEAAIRCTCTGAAMSSTLPMARRSTPNLSTN
jgi:ketosteroid isomerase-like protein